MGMSLSAICLSMIKNDEARSIAQRMLDENVRAAAGGGVAIDDDYTVDSDEWWVFVYNTKRYLQTGDVRQSLVGNRPIMVNKTTGEAKFGRTDISIEAQLFGRGLDQPQPIGQDMSDNRHVRGERPDG